MDDLEEAAKAANDLLNEVIAVLSRGRWSTGTGLIPAPVPERTEAWEHALAILGLEVWGDWPDPGDPRGILKVFFPH